MDLFCHVRLTGTVWLTSIPAIDSGLESLMGIDNSASIVPSTVYIGLVDYEYTRRAQERVRRVAIVVSVTSRILEIDSQKYPP